MTALVPRESLCYDGSELAFVDKEHFIHSAGARVRVASARTGKTVGFVQSPVPGGCPLGISSYAAAPKAGLIALARRSKPPAIDVVAWPGAGAALGENNGPPFDSSKLCKERRSVAMGGAGLEYGALAVSRKGERLAAISAVADAVLTVWDLPPPPDPDKHEISGGGARGGGEAASSSASVDEAVLCASVALPCACDSVAFNPANPSMLLCTASHRHNDGVGGGHPGGLFVYKMSTSHGHTTLTLVECDLDALPYALSPDEQLEAAEAEAEAEVGQQLEGEYSAGAGAGAGGGSVVADHPSHAGDEHSNQFGDINVDHGDGGSEDENEENLHKGHTSHQHGLRSVGAAVWGPGDTIYAGTGAGVVGRFDAATGHLKAAHVQGMGNGTAVKSCVGLVLTKSYVLVASRGRMLYWVKNDASGLVSGSSSSGGGGGGNGGKPEPFGVVEHAATVFGISNSIPPERVCQVAHSPDFRFLLVGTMEGTLHAQAVEPPKDEEKKWVSSGMPDIIPILNDYHEGFALCSTSTQIPVPAASAVPTGGGGGGIAGGAGAGALAMFKKKPAAAAPVPDANDASSPTPSAPNMLSNNNTAATVQAEVFATGGTDGSVRLWWASDAHPACSRTYRSHKQPDGGDGDESGDGSEYDDEGEDGEEPETGQSRGSQRAFEESEVVQELDFGMDGMDEGMVAVAESDSDNDSEDGEGKQGNGSGEGGEAAHPDDEEDPLSLPVVAVTALEAMPGPVPLLAVGLADGQLSLVLVHLDTDNTTSNRGSMTSNGGDGSFDAGGDRSNTHPTGLHLAMLPLDLKQLTHRPITHLAFSPPLTSETATPGGVGNGAAVLLAVGCATEGSVFVVEIAEPSEESTDLLSPRSGSARPKTPSRSLEYKASVFRVVARIQVNSDRTPAMSGSGGGASAGQGSPTSAHSAMTGGGSVSSFQGGGSMVEHGTGADGHHHHHHHHYHGPKVSSLCWSEAGVLLVATSDGEARAYSVPTPPTAAEGYDPAAVADTLLEPLARVVTPELSAPPPQQQQQQQQLQVSHHNGHNHRHHHHLPPLCGMFPLSNAVVAGGVGDGALGAGALLTICPANREPGLNALPPLGENGIALAATGEPGPTGGVASLALPLHPVAVVAAAAALAANGGSSADSDETTTLALAAAGGGNGNSGSHAAGGGGGPPQGHARGVTCCAMAPPGVGGIGGPRLCATGGLEGLIVLWRLGEGGCLKVAELLAHSSPIVSLAFSPSGSAILSTCLDRGIVVTQIKGMKQASLLTAAAANGGDAKKGFVRAAKLLRASSKESAAQYMALHTRARQLRESVGVFGVSGGGGGYGGPNRGQRQNPQIGAVLREADDCDEAAAAMRAQDFDGPLPAAGTGVTWAEEVATGNLAAAGALTKQRPQSGGGGATAAAAGAVAVAAGGQEGGGVGNGQQQQQQQQQQEPNSASMVTAKDQSAVFALAAKLEQLLDANDVASDLERLDRGAFVVDVSRRDAAVAANQASAAAVKAQVQDTDALRDLVSGRIRANCDETMEVRACEVRALVHPTSSVANLPLPKPLPQKARFLECAKRLRMVELLEVRHVVTTKARAAKETAKAEAVAGAKTKDPKQLRALETAAAAKVGASQAIKELERDDGAWPGRRREVPSSVSWILNEGKLVAEIDVVGKMLAALSPQDDGKKKKGGADEEGGGDGGGGAAAAAAASGAGDGKKDGGNDSDDEEGAGENAEAAAANAAAETQFKKLDPASILTYMYPPTALNTSAQRRMQMIFLGELVRDLKKGFNKHFGLLAGAKQDAVDFIEERSVRIREIVKGLGQEDCSFKPDKQSSENPAVFLDVEEVEMSCAPYETEAVKAEKVAAALAKAKAEAEARKDNIGERALMDMMYGTLENNKGSVLEATMDPMPEWLAELVETLQQQTAAMGAGAAATGEGAGAGSEGSPDGGGGGLLNEATLAALTEEQKEEYESYMEKLKAFQAAAEAAREVLREELEKLMGEVKQCCSEFDAKCQALSELRVHAQSSVATQELYLLRLGVGLLEGEDLEAAMGKLQHDLATIAAQKGDLSAQARKCHAQVDEVKLQLAELQTEDTKLEKGLRKALNEVASEPLTNESHRVLVSCFKIRRSGGGAGTGGEESGGGGSGRGQGGRRSSNMAGGGANPRRGSSLGGGGKKLVSAAGGLVGARRASNRTSNGFMGLLKGAQKEEEAQKAALAADPFGDVDTAAAVAAASAGAGGSAGLGGKDIGASSSNNNRNSVTRRLEAAALARMRAPLDREVDCPDGFQVEAQVWQRLNELRIAKIESELELKKLTKALGDMKRAMEFIDSRDEALEHEMEEVEVEVAVLERRKRRCAKDVEVLVKLCQGQVELLQLNAAAASAGVHNNNSGGGGESPFQSFGAAAAGFAAANGGGGSGGHHHNHHHHKAENEVPPPLAPDTRRGVLIAATKVTSLNEEIKAVGAEKIRALGKMKQFRRQINFMEWEDRFMASRLEDLGEFYSDLLLLRVEKSTLQKMQNSGNPNTATTTTTGGGGGGGKRGSSSGGGGAMAEADSANAELAAAGEKRLAVTNRLHAARGQKLNDQCSKLAHQVQERRSENERLKEQLRSLEHSVSAREAIYRARVDAAGGELSAASAAQSRMKRVTMRRRLVDLARTQTEEMDFLRGELDLLRQRTFPSFAHAARHRLLLPPDEVV